MGVVSDVFAFLEAEGLAGGSTAWTLLRRRVMDSPAENQLVVVTEDGGPRPEIPALDGSMGDSAFKDSGVQVRVRGEPWDGDSCATKAQEIFDALHGKRNIVVGSTEYLRVRAQTAEPLFIGFDEQGRAQHTMSFLLLASLPVTS
jgi:hypothetical protein